MNTPIVVANWKMNTLANEAHRLALNIATMLNEAPITKDRCTVVVCPPFVNISIVREVIEGSPLLLGAQNCWTEPYGAYTGEISAPMLRAVGCTHVIVGHSERRTIFREDDELILAKVIQVWNEGMIPILCVGETLHQRQLHQTWSVLQTQLQRILMHAGRSHQWICAYEPVWAIGTGIAAEPQQIEEAHSFIRALLDGHNCQHVPILYGGSVNPDNAPAVFAIRHVDGVLVGGASLVAEHFIAIIQAALHAKQSTT